MSYKVTNRLECAVKYTDDGKVLVFGPKETKMTKTRPYSDKFDVEKVEESKKLKGGR